MLSGKSILGFALGALIQLLTSRGHDGLIVSGVVQGSERASPTPQSTETDWNPTWDTSPDRSRKIKTHLTPTVRLAHDGFRGSPTFENQEQKTKNANARETFARSLPSIPECSSITLKSEGSDDTDFVLQLFNGIEGRSGRLQFVLYRMDTLGESAHGEGTGADTKQGQDGIARSVCSTIRDLTSPEPQRAEGTQPSVADVKPSLQAWEASAGSLEASFSHLRYTPPKGFSSLPDDIRKKENRERYEIQLAEALRKQGPNGGARRTEGGKQITQTHKTEVFPHYMLLVAARTAPVTSETDQLPHVVISAQKRITMLMEAGDPAKMMMYIPDVKVLRGPEDVTLSGRRFVRADFRFRSGSFLSKFSTVNGDYLLEFDFRADNEKDLSDMVNSMQSVVFQP